MKCMAAIVVVALYFEFSNFVSFILTRLYIQQPLSTTSISGHDNDAEWAEYKIKESNMFTVDKYQQVSSMKIRILSALVTFTCEEIL